MAALKVLRNIYQFAIILQQSVSEEVKNWDVVSLQNAVKWATYAQEMSCHIRRSSVHDEMSHKLAEMTLLIRPVTCIYLTLDTLMMAKEILVQNLLYNPHLASSLREELVTDLKKGSSDSEQLEKSMTNIKRLKEDEKTVDCLLNILYTSQSELSLQKGKMSRKQFEEHHQCQHKAKILVKHLIEMYAHAEKKERFKIYVKELLDRISESGGWNSSGALLVELSKVYESEDTYKEISDCVIDWLNQTLVHWREESPLCDSEAIFLCEPANINLKFLEVYLKALEHWSSCFHPVFDDTITWRSGRGFETSALCQHFYILLQQSDPSSKVKEETMKLLVGQTSAGDYSVWMEVAKMLTGKCRNVP